MMFITGKELIELLEPCLNILKDVWKVLLCAIDEAWQTTWITQNMSYNVNKDESRAAFHFFAAIGKRRICNLLVSLCSVKRLRWTS
jgi:hypothetical protein